MKTIEQNYVDSYDRPGCFPIFAALLIICLLISLAANIFLVKKIRDYEKTTIAGKALAYCKASSCNKTNGIEDKDRLLPYYQVEKGEPTIQVGESLVCKVLPERFCNTIGGYRSYYSASDMRGSLGSKELAGIMSEMQ